MKVVIFFCDMVRANLLYKFNKQVEKTKFDSFLEELGGTIYQNAYTPNPDTGHGYSMIYSGVSCKKNGCDDIGKYPEENLKENIPNLENLFIRNNIDSYYINSSRNKLAGTLTKNLRNKIIVDFKNNTYKEEFIKLKEKIQKTKDNFTMITFDDYHTAADECGANMKSDKKGKEKLYEAFNLFFSIFDKNEFDHIILFSDHGNVHKYGFKDERVLNLLNGDRTNIFLQYRKKNDTKLIVNKELRSLLDIYPTIKEIFEDEDIESIDGISLNKNLKEERKIIIESYSKFSPPNTLDIWGIREKNYYYITNIIYSKLHEKTTENNWKEIEIKEEDKVRYDKLLRKETINFYNMEKRIKKDKEFQKFLNEEYRYTDNTPLNKVNIERLKGFKFSRIPLYIKWYILKNKI
ncbi:MAG: hypothetical protein ACRC4T_24090 [Cetobacterium sp.]